MVKTNKPASDLPKSGGYVRVRTLNSKKAKGSALTSRNASDSVGRKSVAGSVLTQKGNERTYEPSPISRQIIKKESRVHADALERLVKR